MKLRQRVRRTLSDALFLFLLPLAIGLLPWRAGFALLRRIAAWRLGFGDVVEAALQEASRALPSLDRKRFCRDYRLLLLVDRCDTMLCLLRSRRWWQARVDVRGDSLEQLPAGLLLNSHWGSGNWIWKLLEAHGTPAWFVARRAGVGDVGRGRLSRGYLALRGWMVRRAGCLGVIFTGGSSEHVLEVLRQGQSVLGMLDLPARPGQARAAVGLLGHQAHFPVGLAVLANQAGVASSIVSCGLDVDSGRRRLHLEVLPPDLTPEQVVRRYAAHLQRRIEAEPAQWQAWPQAALYFVEADTVEADRSA